MRNTSFIPACLALTEGQTIEATIREYHELKPLFDWMLSCTADRKFLYGYTVVVSDRAQITPHSHPEDVLLYYADPQGVPVIINGVVHTPEPGDLFIIPKHVEHSVPQNLTGKRRVSIAMKVTDGAIPERDVRQPGGAPEGL